MKYIFCLSRWSGGGSPFVCRSPLANLNSLGSALGPTTGAYTTSTTRPRSSHVGSSRPLLLDTWLSSEVKGQGKGSSEGVGATVGLSTVSADNAVAQLAPRHAAVVSVTRTVRRVSSCVCVNAFVEPPPPQGSCDGRPTLGFVCTDKGQFGQTDKQLWAKKKTRQWENKREGEDQE
jgi:hypothetical protein